MDSIFGPGSGKKYDCFVPGLELQISFFSSSSFFFSFTVRNEFRVKLQQICGFIRYYSMPEVELNVLTWAYRI
jgi:hypothetical protein